VKPDALVVGAGVIGLTSAVRLLEHGWRVRLWSADDPRRLTSAVAAALWYPYRIAPAERVHRWARATYDRYLHLAGDPSTGVRLASATELWRTTPSELWADPLFADVPRHPAPSRPPYTGALRLRLPVAETPRHLPWLWRRFYALGGRFERRWVAHLEEALAAAELVVLAAGLGAGALVGDATLVPVRGQVVRVANPGLEEVWLDLDPPEPGAVTYVVPRRDDVVLGGTAEEGRADTTADPAQTAAIRARCAALEPRLAAAPMLGVEVGLRPVRPAVRLEAEDHGGTRLVHNYGHGGAGWTVAWGCADEVVALALR